MTTVIGTFDKDRVKIQIALSLSTGLTLEQVNEEYGELIELATLYAISSIAITMDDEYVILEYSINESDMEILKTYDFTEGSIVFEYKHDTILTKQMKSDVWIKKSVPEWKKSGELTNRAILCIASGIVIGFVIKALEK